MPNALKEKKMKDKSHKRGIKCQHGILPLEVIMSGNETNYYAKWKPNRMKYSREFHIGITLMSTM